MSDFRHQVHAGFGRSRAVRSLDASALVALAVAGAALLLGWREGGFAASDWGPAAVALLALTGLALALGAGWPATPPERLMLAAAAAFVAWSFLTTAWAAFPAQAVAGSGKTLLYLAGFALCALVPSRHRRAVLYVFGFGVALIAAVTFLRLALAGHPGQYFVGSRLIEPIGYENGNACFWMVGACALLYPGTSSSSGPLVRASGCAGVALLLDVSILSQSRAWFYLLPVLAVVALALSRERWHTAIGIAIAGAASAAAAPTLTHVYDAGVGTGDVGAAATAAGLAALSAAVAGAAWALLDRRVAPPSRTARRVALGVLAAVVVAAAVVGVASTPRLHHPVALVQSKWRDFKTPYKATGTGQSRFGGSISGDRWREWTVAWRAFLRHPVAGVGADNYEAFYLRERADALFDPRYPHSTPLRVLSQLGLVGTLLFVGWMGIALWRAFALRRHADPDLATAAAGGLLVFFYWLAHSSLDWFWEIPALALPAFALLGLAGARAGAPVGGGKRVRVATGFLAAATIVLVVPPWFEDVLVNRGAALSATSESAARRDFRWAARVDPWSAEPYLYLGSVELNRGETRPAEAAFARAAKREPQNWYAYLQLAVTDVQTGNFAAAERHVTAARRLNPKDPGIALAARLVRRKIMFSPALLNNLYVTQLDQRFGVGTR